MRVDPSDATRKFPSVAEALWLRPLARVLGSDETPWEIRLWNGRSLRSGDAPARYTIVVRSPATLAMLLLRPTMLAAGEAFVDGRLDVEGDLIAAVESAYRLCERPVQGAASTGGADRRPEPGRRSSEDVARHYEVSNEFYALFLDRRMVYTCGYYPTPATTLDQAQEVKLDLVCRKLGLAPGERLLDLGCGWGGLVAWASERYGATAHGVTISSSQAAWATQMLDRSGLAHRARVERCDYRDLAPSLRFDKIAAVGVIEHVGVTNYPEYFRRVRGWLRPGGLFLNHGITHRTTSPGTSGMAFLDRYVFPGGDLATIEHTLSTMEAVGFEILHTESLGPHYATTTREWLARLVAVRPRAVELVGDRTVRIWIGYLAAAAVAFGAGWIDVHQVVARPRA